ncbi:carbohydrate ABC transporter permease [Treponema lecithinolyticum]|uniref:sn-glycerol-3-phosphate transport system permease protein UgpE n=1 Tax=Treponema lecithinolyticum ATCC 700332 TaxID=1321815 RepID=A0ABN0NWF2_TRELE|nr:carbohydrate ABC transporter permease [Treponema lecithinolyticum]ERJ91666.1 ABC transporter, permease protein [Treponema lecithinolyticum ATCC 700332]
MKSVFRLERLVVLALKTFMILIILCPIFYAMSVSFMTTPEIFKRPPTLIPSSFLLTSYRQALKTAPLFRYLFNSFVMASSVMIGQITLASMAAFSFSHFKFKTKQIIFMAFLTTMMIPAESLVISNYLTIGDMRLYDTYLAMILPNLASAMSIFFMRQAFMQIPTALYEAARIEGCSNFRYLFTMLLPMSKGSIGAICIYTFIKAWNAYLWPLLVTNKTSMRTVQIGVGMLYDREAASYNMIMAGIVIVLIPSIVVFIVGQRQILSGTLSGAVKG